MMPAAAAGVAAWALYQFVACIKLDRIIADTPLVRLRSAAQGYVKVSGVAKADGGQSLSAPLSSLPCIWWRYEIFERSEDRNRKSEWRTVDSAASIAPFVLADADGECAVGPVNADITPTSHDEWYGEMPRPSCVPVPRPGSGRFRYTEWRLTAGDKLSVIGELRSKSGIASQAETAGALLSTWKRDQPTLLARFDSNHDGRIDAGEWETARRAAAEAAGTSAASVERTAMISEPADGRPFVISALDSAGLVRRAKLHAVLYLGLGAAGACVCAWSIGHPTLVARAAVQISEP